MASPRLSYIICTSPRTGSSLLCAALGRTGVAGRPAEYFDIHAHNVAYWQKQLAITDDAAYLGRVLDAGTTPNGVFGLKLHWHQAPALMAKLSADCGLLLGVDGIKSTERMDELLRQRLSEVRYIWLRRKNLIAQAISYYRAGKTDLWRVAAGSEPDTLSSVEVQFDFDTIHQNVKLVEQFDRAWYQFFMRDKLRALVIIYEDFVAAYENTVRGVLGYLGFGDQQLKIVPPQYRRQADDISLAWERRYREMLVDRSPSSRFTPKKALRSRRATRPVQPAASELRMIAYDLGTGVSLPVEPAPPGRAWMDETQERFAYRCLPLVIANQAGWVIRNSHRLTAVWDGTVGTAALRVSYDSSCPNPYATSHFGDGLLTFSVGALFRTPPGYNLHVRGPSNWPKDGLYALEAIVETDWNRATFTMNWKFTRANHPVTFEVGEPIAMIAPVSRTDIERFRPQWQPIAADPEWQKPYLKWSESRAAFNSALANADPEAVAARWQRHYVLGMTVDETDAPEHQTSLALAPFEDKRTTKG